MNLNLKSDKKMGKTVKNILVGTNRTANLEYDPTFSFTIPDNIISKYFSSSKFNLIFLKYFFALLSSYRLKQFSQILFLPNDIKFSDLFFNDYRLNDARF